MSLMILTVIISLLFVDSADCVQGFSAMGLARFTRVS
jgi:hypothetical protein